MTARYHIDPYQTEAPSEIVTAFEEDDGRFCVALTEPLFYPQGGGQKGDRGVLIAETAQYEVIDTIKDKFSSDQRPLSILSKPAPELTVGQCVTMRIDWPLRHAQMRLHSIVHLHHCMMETALGQKIPNPSTSDLSHDGTAVNRYETDLVTEQLALSAIDDMRKAIQAGASIITRDDPEKLGFRYWECLGFIIPCGGTHLKDLSEVGNFSAQVSKKKGRVRIDFQLK